MSSPRPHSAEIRPGSSQLSRFVESTSEGSGPWGGLTSAEKKLGTASSRSSDFTLSSGDFPTLGSEKSSETPSRQGHSSYGRLGLASSATPIQKESASSPHEDGPIDAIDVKVSVNTWTSGRGILKWHNHIPTQTFRRIILTHGMELQFKILLMVYGIEVDLLQLVHMDLGALLVTTLLNLLGIITLSFQLGLCPTHRQIPVRPVPNSQVGPRAGISTTSYNPKPGETYHPRMPDSYSVPAPVLPVRHGVYPGPVPYDGYYGPPRMSFCNPNEKDTHNTGTVLPHVYNRFSNQNACPDPGNFPARPVPFCPGPALSKEQIESDRTTDDHRGPYKVLLKQHNGWGENDSEGNHENPTAASMPHAQRGSLQRKPTRENDWEVDHRKNEPEDLSKSVVSEESSSDPICNQQGCISVAPVNPPESKTNAVDEGLLKKPEPIASPSEGLQHIPVIKKDAALIDKIEGLNTKARISDGRTEARPTREEKEKQLEVMNVKADFSASGSVRSAVLKEKSYAGGMFNPPHQGPVDASITDGGHEPTAVGRLISNQEERQASLDSIIGERTQDSISDERTASAR